METTYFGDVETRVKFARGYCKAMNSMQVAGVPFLDPDKAEKSIRKQVAKYYNLDNKYDGKGNLRNG